MSEHRPAAAARRPSRARLLAIAFLIATAATLLAARRADAGNYVVTQCSSLNPAPGQATWERSSDHYRARSRCDSSEGLQSYHDAADSGLWHYGAWVWRAPAGTVFTSVQANASLTYQAGHRGQLVAVRPGGELVEFGDEHNDFRVHSLERRVHAVPQLAALRRAGSGQPCGRAGGDGAHAYVRGVFLSTEDRATPALALTGGSLLGDRRSSAACAGSASSASDAGGGIRKVYVEGNGVALVTDIRNCALVDGFATALSPCPDDDDRVGRGADRAPRLRHRTEHGHRVRRGPRPRRGAEPHLRAAPDLGRQRLPRIERRRAAPSSARASATAAPRPARPLRPDGDRPRPGRRAWAPARPSAR